MLVGHFAAGFVAKTIDPEVSLGTLVLAAMLPDVLWPIFTMAKLEYTVKPGQTSSAFDAPLSHSLLMVAIWAVIFAGGYYLARRNKRGALLLLIIVLSHWVFDAIAHQLTLAPGAQKHYGLHLWQSLPATIIIEGGFWLLAIISYVRVTRAKSWVGICAFWPVVAFLTFIWVTNISSGPPPPDKVFGSLIFFLLLIAWAYGMNRARTAESADG